MGSSPKKKRNLDMEFKIISSQDTPNGGAKFEIELDLEALKLLAGAAIIRATEDWALAINETTEEAPESAESQNEQAINEYVSSYAGGTECMPENEYLKGE
jgi:hypothetical protein